MGVEKNDWTERARKAIERADKVLLRTGVPRSAQTLTEAGIAFETLDCLYEKSRNFQTLARNLAAEVVRRAEGCNLCYCVDGGACEDESVALLRKRKDVTVIEGVTKGGYCAAKAGIAGGYLAVSTYSVKERKLTLPLVVYDIDSREVAGDIKLALADKFGDEAQVFFFSENTGIKIPMYEVDRQKTYDYTTMIAVYEQPLLEKKRFDTEDLFAILRLLRAPDGCPWDRVQTHESIRINAIEEAYELVDAIDCKDEEKMCEEAGDVMMQALFHTLIEEERGTFNLTDVTSGVCEKLITRHTHVFGKDRAKNADGALSVWDQNKMTEKHQTTYSDAVKDVPECFPALLRAQKIIKRMSKGGWNFQSPVNCKKKFDEEAEELAAAVKKGDKAEIAAEYGDVLMVLAHTAYMLGIDGEQALLDTVKKCANRFIEWEKLVLADGKDVHNLTVEEWNGYYKRAKKNVSSH